MQITWLWPVGLALAMVLLFSGCGRQPGAREFRNGVRQVERGQYERARNLMEKSINKRPGSEHNAAAYQYLGHILWQLEEPDNAMAAFEMSRRLNPQLSEPVYSLGVLAYYQDDVETALRLLGDAARLNTQDTRSLEYIGAIHIRQQNWQSARRALYDALSRSPQSPRILTALSVVAYEVDGAERAVSYLMQALERDPKYAPALFNLGVLHERESGQNDDALAYYAEYLQVHPRGGKAFAVRQGIARLRGEPEPIPDPSEITPVRHTQLRRPPPEDTPPVSDLPDEPTEREPDVREPTAPARTPAQLLEDATARARAGQMDQALALCRRAAEMARQAGDLALAERAFKRAVELAPDRSRSHFALGRFYVEQNRNRDAASSYRKAIELEPDQVSYLMALADVLKALGEYDESLLTLRKAVEQAPRDPEPLWAVAELYEQAMLRSRAADSFEQFASRFSTDPRAARAAERARALRPVEQPRPVEERGETVRNEQAARLAFSRALEYQQRQEWDDAIRYYRRAIENQPDLEAAHFNLGTALMETRDLQGARDAFRRSVELAPNRTAARYNLALVLRDLNESRTAIQQLEALLARSPNYAPAHLLVGLLYNDDDRTMARTRTHYRRFLELAPNDPNAAFVRSWLEQNP